MDTGMPLRWTRGHTVAVPPHCLLARYLAECAPVDCVCHARFPDCPVFSRQSFAEAVEHLSCGLWVFHSFVRNRTGVCGEWQDLLGGAEPRCAFFWALC